jgi:vancomycin resistance protein YoaR
LEAGIPPIGEPSVSSRSRFAVPVVALLIATCVAAAWAQEPRPQTPTIETRPWTESDTAATTTIQNEYPAILSSFTTTLIGSLPARTDNVKLAVAALNGTVLKPGDQLSFDRVVGPRTRERGYQPAPVILHEARQIQIGGGVCQVASTVFVAALLSGLTAVERYRHSTPVDYVALGQDATIAWGAKDLKIRNTSEQSVRLKVEIVGGALTARFEGQDPLADTYELVTEDRETPADTASGELPGREIDVYRVRKSHDKVLDREHLYRDVYPPTRPAEERPGARP